MALVLLMEKISKSIDNGDIVCGVFLDFSKAFDTINHKILLTKLNQYGIRGICSQWISNYLSKRQQYVCFNKINSERHDIVCGVPQGSILGPLLFLLYINDLPNVSKILYTILFADDTNVFLTRKISMVEWLHINRLSLNVKKTKFMIFSQKKNIANDVDIKLNGEYVNRVESTKFLGVYIDSKLSWCDHLKYIKNKISKGIGILYKGRKLFKQSTLLTLYYSFLYPYFSYCIEVWGSAANCHISSVFKLQKKALRILISANYRSPTEPIFTSLKILPLAKLYEYAVILFMFKYIKNMLPNVFDDTFIINADIHNYSTRQTRKLHVPIGKSSMVYKTVKYRGTYLWNYVSDKCNNNCGILSYKQLLRSYLLLNNIPKLCL